MGNRKHPPRMTRRAASGNWSVAFFRHCRSICWSNRHIFHVIVILFFFFQRIDAMTNTFQRVFARMLGGRNNVGAVFGCSASGNRHQVIDNVVTHVKILCYITTESKVTSTRYMPMRVIERDFRSSGTSKPSTIRCTPALDFDTPVAGSVTSVRNSSGTNLTLACSSELPFHVALHENPLTPFRILL